MNTNSKVNKYEYIEGNESDSDIEMYRWSMSNSILLVNDEANSGNINDNDNSSRSK
jgi:hypothetical protein